MEPNEYLFSKEFRGFGPEGIATLFYPGGFTDYGPLDLLVNHSSSAEALSNGIVAIYADYWMTFDVLDQFVHKLIRRYQAECNEPIELTPQDFRVKSIDAFYPKAWSDHQRNFYKEANQTQLGFRYFFPTINLTLIYLKADAIETYKILEKAKIYPNFVVLQDHGGFGGGWVDFGGESALYKAVKLKPQYLYVADNTEVWPGYLQVTEGFRDEGQMHNFSRVLYALSK
jgi:hypothetical protein